MTYQDARNLLAIGQGVRRTAVYGIGAGIESGRPDLPPFLVRGRRAHARLLRHVRRCRCCTARPGRWPTRTRPRTWW
jgi:hypothetical protein